MGRRPRNVTEVVSCTPPSLAVMVSVWARVEASVVMNTPSALVTPEMLPKLLSVPEADSVTAVFTSKLPLASSTVTVSVVVAVPFAATEPGLATRVEVAADGPPATKLTDVVSCTPPSLAVTVSVCARVEARVVVNTPSALVTPEMLPKLLSVPEADSVTAVFANRSPLASSTVTVSVVVVAPSAGTEFGLAVMVKVVPETTGACRTTSVPLLPSLCRLTDVPA